METFHEFLQKHPRPNGRHIRNYNRQIDRSMRRSRQPRKQ